MAASVLHHEDNNASRFTDKEREHLYECIFPILANKGIKSCTMDLVAAELGISKRTLYEIFESKDEMLASIITYFMKKSDLAVLKIFHESANMMEAMRRHAFIVQEQMESFSPAFFRDLTRYPAMKHHIESRQKEMQQHLHRIVEKGIAEGVFREDVNYRVTLRLLLLQHEALSRMTDFFPPDVTLAEAHEEITTGFLRSIASPEGMEILDQLTATHRLQSATKDRQN